MDYALINIVQELLALQILFRLLVVLIFELRLIAALVISASLKVTHMATKGEIFNLLRRTIVEKRIGEESEEKVT